MSELTLKENRVGSIAYKLTVDGSVEEIITPEYAIEYLHGAENLIYGLEEALDGKKVGDSFAVTIAPEKGYGAYDEEDVDIVPIKEFGMDVSGIQVGEELELWNEEDEELFEATVLEVTDEHIKLDFNHPLAGKTLHYEIQVVDVRNATQEEIDMGVPESIMDEMLEALDDEDVDDEYYSINNPN
jgi:FKBP-type peptidyl-prolyl cis-trans isomerase SlyD